MTKQPSEVTPKSKRGRPVGAVGGASLLVRLERSMAAGRRSLTLSEGDMRKLANVLPYADRMHRFVASFRLAATAAGGADLLTKAELRALSFMADEVYQ